MNYAGFWDRINHHIIIIFLLFLGLDLKETVEINFALVVLGCIAIAAYLFIRTKFIHMVMVDKNGQPLHIIRKISHTCFMYAPIIAYCLYAIYWINNIDAITQNTFASVDDTFTEVENDLLEPDGEVDDTGLENIIIAAFRLQFAIYVPALVLLYIVNWTPFFIKKYRRTCVDLLLGTHIVYSSEKPFSWIRILFKTPVFVFSFLFLGNFAVIAPWIAYNIYDPPLNPEVKTFFTKAPFTREDNVSIAWEGLGAPSGTEDTYQYGLDVIDKKVPGTPILRFQGEVEEVETPEQLHKMVKDNQELIDRYIDFHQYQYKGLQNDLISYGSGQDLISIHRLFQKMWVDEKLSKSKNGEEIIQLWINDTRFLQRMLNSSGTIVEKAIWMIQYGSNLDVLPEIIALYPNLLETFKGDLTEILEKDFMQDIWSVEATWKSEYDVLRTLRLEHIPSTFLFFKPNDMRNDFLNLAKDMIWLSKQDTKDIPLQGKIIEEKYSCIEWYCFTYNIGKRLMMGGFTKGTELYMNGHAFTARQRMLMLWMDAKTQEITLENMPAFLQKSDKSLYDPFTGKPFEWDETRDAIIFIRNPEEPFYIKRIFYNPLKDKEPDMNCELDEELWFEAPQDETDENGPYISVCFNTNRPATDILTELAEQAGYKHNIEVLSDNTVTLAAEAQPFEAVVKEICEQASFDCNIIDNTLTVKHK